METRKDTSVLLPRGRRQLRKLQVSHKLKSKVEEAQVVVSRFLIMKEVRVGLGALGRGRHRVQLQWIKKTQGSILAGNKGFDHFCLLSTELPGHGNF